MNHKQTVLKLSELVHLYYTIFYAYVQNISFFIF